MSDDTFKKMVVVLLFMIFGTLLVGGCVLYAELNLMSTIIQMKYYGTTF